MTIRDFCMLLQSVVTLNLDIRYFSLHFSCFSLHFSIVFLLNQLINFLISL